MKKRVIKKRINKKLLISLMTAVIVLVSGIFIYYKNSRLSIEEKVVKLINISDLSPKFMDNYFEKYSKLSDQQKDHMLIAISKKKIKNSYGATEIIEGPNNNYFLIYSNNADKKNAQNKLKEEKYILNVTENKKNQFTIDDNEENTFNSWGVQATGLDYGMELVSGIDADAVTVAVLDTGCDMDLFNKYYAGKIEKTYNVLSSSDDDMYDNFGHGTHVAGTIAESTPDNVKIVPVKISDQNDLYDTDIILGIEWITYNHQADVINMSFGGDGSEEEVTLALYQAIEAAKQDNIISVAAAGNDSSSAPHYPSAFDNTISISSVDSDLNLSEFSNYGSMITFAAPGTGIKSILGPNTAIGGSDDNDDDHEVLSGTSMATPHAVAMVAILKSFDVNLSLESVINQMKTYAIDLGDEGYDELFGYGLINLNGAVVCKATDQGCDEYNMFKVLTPTAMAVNELSLTNYNYGSITNLLNTTMSFTEIDGYDYQKKLYELDDIEITGYDPYSPNGQTITIKYKDFEVQTDLKNPYYYESGWTYEQENDKYLITGYKDSGLEISKLYFPETIDNHQINGIAFKSEFGYYQSLNDLSSDAEYFEELYFPESITEVRDAAFLSLPNVRKVISLANEIALYSYSFSDLSKMHTFVGNVTLLENEPGVFERDTLLKNVTISNNTTIIPEFSFSHCPNLKNIVIPEGVTEIGQMAFMSSGLTSISFPSSVQTIETRAFFNNKISEVTIPANITNIGESSFGQNDLYDIYVSEQNPVYDSRNDSNVIIETATNKVIQGSYLANIPSSVKAIGSYAFAGIRIYDIVIPEGVETIEDHAFDGCYYLHKVVLPNSVNSIGDHVFDRNVTGIFNLFTVLWVPRDSYAHQYAIEHNNTYVIIGDLEDDRDIFGMEIFSQRERYIVGESPKDYIQVFYYYIDEDGFAQQVEVTDFEIEFQNGDSFQTGDTSYVVIFNEENGYHNVRVQGPNVTIITPSDISLPTVDVLLGETFCQYEFPDGIFQTQYCYFVTKYGDFNLIGSYFDYETQTSYYDVVLHIHVIEKNIVQPCINYGTNNIKIYDGTTNLDKNKIHLCDLDDSMFEVEEAYLSYPDVSDYAEAYARIRINDDVYENYSFGSDKQESYFYFHMMVANEYEKPTLNNNTHYQYDGESRLLELDNFDSNIMELYVDGELVSGDYYITDAGNYYIAIYLKDGPYVWTDGTRDLVEFTITVDPLAANIEYTSSDVNVSYDGLAHGIELNIISPDDVTILYYDENSDCESFEEEDYGWYCDNYYLEEMPTYSDPGVYTIRYKLHSDVNHEDVYDENTLTITNNNIPVTATGYNGVYDGQRHSIDVSVGIDYYIIRYSLDNQNFDLINPPSFADVGSYTVYYRIISNGYDTYYGSNDVNIYGLKNFDSSLSVKSTNIITTKTSSFKDLSKKIKVYALSTEIIHYDSGNNIVSRDNIKTGDSITININNAKNYKYTISYIGDVNGNGDIDIIDYIRIMKDIMGTAKLSGVYYYAADVNENQKIDIIDYIRIMKIIMEDN